MKTTIKLSVFALTMYLFSCNNSSIKTEQTFNYDTTTLKSGEVFYQCEMDHEIISDKTGNCPKCKMELTAVHKK